MSFVTAYPEELATAADSLSGTGMALAAQNAAAGAPISGVMAPSTDEVSISTAAKFAAHGLMYQQISAQASAIHEMFVAALSGGANCYATAEATNALAAG